MTFYPGMDTLMENTVLNVKNRSHTVTAEIEVPDGTLKELERLLGGGSMDGVLAAQGGRFAGWALYVNHGRAKYCHNWFDHDYYYVRGTKPLPEGTVNVRYHLDFDGQYGGGGTGRLYVNEELVGEGRIEKTVPNIFSADETLDIGCDLALPVTDEYPEGKANTFQGEMHWVRIDLEDDEIHEDQAAAILADALAGDGIIWKDEPREGKIKLLAGKDGLAFTVSSGPIASGPSNMVSIGIGILLLIAAVIGSAFSLRRVLRIDPASALGN